MRKKKLLLPVLIFVFLLQLCAPIGLITYHNALEKNILQYGTDYKFKAEIIEMRDGTIRYRVQDAYYYWDAHRPYYIAIRTEADGFAVLSMPTDDKPQDTPYLYVNNGKNFPNGLLEISTENKLHYRELQDFYITKQFESEEVYLKVRVYQGHNTVLGLYVNDTPMDDWLTAHGLYI